MGEAKRKAQQQPPPRLKIAVGVPSQTMVHADFAFALTGLCASSARIFDLAVISEKNSMITAARNNLVQRTMDLGADYLLFIDSDMIFPMDALERLISHKKDIVGATYNKRVHPYESLGKLRGSMADVTDEGLVEAEYMPGGFMLYRMEVFKTLMEPGFQQQLWFREHYDRADPTRMMSEDYAICEAARAMGYKIWADLELTSKIAHIGENPVWCKTNWQAEREKARVLAMATAPMAPGPKTYAVEAA